MSDKFADLIFDEDHTDHDIRVVVGSSRLMPDVKVIAAFDRAVGPGRTYLAPIRWIDTAARASEVQGPRSPLLDDLRRQAVNLRSKIRSMDKLGLSTIRFSEKFAAARVFICTSRASDSSVWNLGRRFLEEVGAAMNERVVSQVDYDQRRKHPDLGSALESIDFKTKHEPSAIATIAAFDCILQRNGILLRDSRWSVRGVGDLGIRIVRLLVQRGVRSVHAFDIDPQRTRPLLSVPEVKVCASEEEFLASDVHAQVSAAEAGWLSMSVAERIVSSRTLIAFGGPEAGLDRNSEAIRLATSTGKTFIPSMLCGSLGLVSNMIEVLGQDEDLADQEQRLRALVGRIASLAAEKNVHFHQAFGEYLSAS